MQTTVRNHKRVCSFFISLLVGGFLCLPTAGCGATTQRSTLQYSDRARREYESAMQLFAGEEWTDAQEAFQRVKREFGVSRWGWLAELRLADIDFRTEKYAEAVGAYRSWIRYHPGQPEVTYARFMIAKAHFQQIPQDWALVPSAWERDLGSAQDAQDALRNFIRDYGQSEQATEARELLRRARAVLARGEIHVAEFYLRRNQHDAAVARFRTVLENYSGSGVEAEALLKLGELYLSMGRESDAREAFSSLVEHFSTSEYVASARRYLDFLRSNTR
jgi:outer membrane protein assembly factor BamD